MSRSATPPGTALVLVCPMPGQIDGHRLAELQRAAPGAEIRLFGSEDEMLPFVAQADVIASKLSEPAFARARSLKWLHSWLAGPDQQLFPALARSDVVFTCCKGNGAVPLAEHAMMLMLMLDREALRCIDDQRRRVWSPFMHGELGGKTLGILGTGHAGKDLAAKARAFHMRVLGMNRSGRAVAGFDEIFAIAALHRFLGHCDVLVNLAPLTTETRGLLDERAFRAMKPTAHYVCLSRGGIADDTALLRALSEGWIAGAGLDAHGEEPLPPDSPFWAAPNTLVTPHNAATTQKTRERGYLIFKDNLARFMRGDALGNTVDKLGGY